MVSNPRRRGLGRCLCRNDGLLCSLQRAAGGRKGRGLWHKQPERAWQQGQRLPNTCSCSKQQRGGKLVRRVLPLAAHTPTLLSVFLFH